MLKSYLRNNNSKYTKNEKSKKINFHKEKSVIRIKSNIKKNVTPFVKAGATFSAVLLRTAFTGLKYPGL